MVSAKIFSAFYRWVIACPPYRICVVEGGGGDVCEDNEVLKLNFETFWKCLNSENELAQLTQLQENN
jgi:hypothetical protein